MHSSVKSRMASLAAVLLCLAGLAAQTAERPAERIWAGGKLVVWPYYPGDSTQLKSITLVQSQPDEWEYWEGRGVVPATAKTWQSILTDTTVDQGVEAILGLDFGGNPAPVVCLDEFGFDYGGQTDEKSARILLELRRRRPDLGIVVYQMRGPFNGVLAGAYREAVDAVGLECYAGPSDYWWIETQIVAARLQGLLDKCVVLLGLGTGGQPGEVWPSTKEDVESQVRYVRLVAPEARGIGFFVGKADPEVVSFADDLCGRFLDLPADGSGLPPEVLALHESLAGRHAQPFLVCAPSWVQPDRSFENPGRLVQPVAFRALIMNLGGKDAAGAKIRLRNTPDKGGDVFAEGTARSLPAGKVSVALLSVLGPPGSSPWKSWLDWVMEVEAPGAEVLQFKWAR
jgi:hypothetical protein